MSKEATINFKEPRIFLLIVTIILIAVVLFYFIASMITSVGYQAYAEAEQAIPTEQPSLESFTIILDAGHGGEDPGAVVGDLEEKALNLQITTKLATFLDLSGYNVLLTRSEDRLLYNSGEENRKKYYDLYNRLKIAENYEYAIFISLHINKFPSAECKGLQTFYSLNHPQSEALAESLQQASKLLMTDNRRTIKSDQKTIFLLKELQIPAVLVECGFLSNANDAKNLSNQEYQNMLAFSLYCGISNYIEEQKIENQLYMQ